jgi:uracil phosphoribosyltransferase
MTLTVLEHPLAKDLLTDLRDKGTPPAPFRAYTRRLGWLLILEATKDLATTPDAIETPMEPMQAERLAERIVAVPVLRAGLGLLDAASCSTRCWRRGAPARRP